ncbi:hypothetical protein PR048_001304, partial [Dryococelus australis]
MVTPRYLATGRTLEDLKFSCRIAPKTNVRTLLNGVFPTLPKYLSLFCCARAKQSLDIPFLVLLQCPTTEEEWENVAREFEHRWNFPNCIGAVDGKHVAITPPPGSGSYFYNYKIFHSQVLLGTVNANYELLYFSFGTNGRVSDGGVFEVSDLSKKLEDGSLKLPKERNCRWEKNVWYVLVSDGAFPLREYIMKPFSRKVATPARKIFNYRSIKHMIIHSHF